MKKKIQCPSCNDIFEIEMSLGVDQCKCPSCGADLEITAVFNGIGDAISITTTAIEKRKKFESIDASGVKEIAEMQRYIDNLENYLWRMAMFIKGRDDGKTVLDFTERGSTTNFATTEIYNFIKGHKEEKK